MTRKNRKHSMLMFPSRSLLARMGQFFLLTLLLLMLVLGKHQNSYVAAVKMHLSDAFSPVIAVVSAPADALYNLRKGIKNWAYTYQQNQQLLSDNRALLQWQSLAKELQVENEKLRALLQVAPKRDARFTSAQIVSEQGSAFSNAALINAGKEDDITTGQAVISERGLVGRVVEVGAHSAQILLLTDMNSRIPVMNERTREKMILVGKSGNFPTLSYVSADSTLRKGDRIITSGDGGIFPKNIAVGMVRDARKTDIQVELFADLADIEYVSVVQFDKK